MKQSEKIQKWRRIMAASEIIAMPRSQLATFGPTSFSYWCLSALSDLTTRIRSGIVTAERPTIILPHELREMFEGFLPDARQFVDEFFEQVGDKLRTLGYRFRHELKRQETVNKSLSAACKNLLETTKDENRSAVIRGPDTHWEVSLLKFTLEMAARSFSMNVTELEERNFFDPDRQLRYKVEKLFSDAQKSPEAVKILGEFLRQNSIFEEYEDRFFDLVQKSRPS